MSRWRTLTSIAFLLCLLVPSGLAAQDEPQADSIRYFHLDAIGSVRVITDHLGNVVERHDYTPFGTELCGTTPCAASQPGQPRRFAGKERDAETGFDHFGARSYEAAVARFTAVDPVLNAGAAIAEPQRWNRYTYALNNPWRFVDPDGNDPRHALGTLGEKLAQYELRRAGFTIVLSALRKPVNSGGFDFVAKKGSEVLVGDNKAFLTRKSAGSATSLVENLDQNLTTAINELQARLERRSLSAAERTAIERSIVALETGAYRRVVTGAGGVVARVGSKVAAAGVSFLKIGKWGAGAVSVITELVFADQVDAQGLPVFLKEVELTPDEQALYLRYYAGEEIFAEGN